MAKMSETEIKTALGAAIADADGGPDSTLASESVELWQRYFSEPYGTEKKGRSSIVMSDVMDAVEAHMPGLMRVFTSSDKVVTIQPSNADNVDEAKQRTAYVNHVFWNENAGYKILLDFFRDALVARIGIVKVFPEELETSEGQEYTGLTSEGLAQVINQEGTKLLTSSHEDTGEFDILVDDETGQARQIPRWIWDITTQTTKTEKIITVETLPIDEFLFQSGARNLKQANYAAHIKTDTISSFVATGLDEKMLQTVTTDPNSEDSSTNNVKSSVSGVESSMDNQRTDSNQRRITIVESYINMDQDGDGIAELRRIMSDKSGSVIFEDQPWDNKPFATITPLPITHKLVGLGVADSVLDFARINTTLVRQMLDNLTITNNPQMLVLEELLEDPDALTEFGPGGQISVTGPGAVTILEIPFVAAQVMPIIEMFDRFKAERTGISQTSRALDKEALANQSATASNNDKTASQARVELIARTFAETGIADMFGLIDEAILEHQDSEKTILLNGEFTSINPTAWKSKLTASVDVGLGVGDRQVKAATLRQIAEAQGELKADPETAGMVTAEQQFNLIEDFAATSDINDITRYINDPSKLPEKEPLPPQKHPAVIEAENVAEINTMKAQSKIENDRIEATADAEAELIRANGSVEIDRGESAAKIDIMQTESAAKIANKEDESASAVAIKEATAESEAVLEEFKIANDLPGGQGNIPEPN